ncbi:MAG: branched-chain amino acid transport system II carrier protein [Lactobacillus sp.]|jgi:LIVCS family branched-chain amino acid:cation transporter|nr:branched-chain amino acid transport system II carrier protein [Lactobacillus sp.]MCH3906351.1 branched-chain amino acid transport system II carrier protein [Lactobacillus sp.]MCH3990076.1 branched-chain amino acid transport system II carrier protein [Lactobacillus sp.]MCH4069210.1 branched-chain amino acid transport system II carrier protein [Lactobacillus sp.]MCI1303512.1 branched-chain amino acid transport system II carrier protein [Lactobacillus sp.]
MENLTSRKLTWKHYLVVASLLFGLFFGAGNLIFPLHLGQLAGAHWGQAAAGFLITGVLLPLLSVLAVAITRSEGVYDIGKPLGAGFAVVFMVLIHATIGPLFGTPRTATVSFTVGIAPFLPKNVERPALLIFSALFFAAAFAFSYQPNHILSNIGKVLNPLFLALLFLVFVVAFLRPLGNPNTAAVTSAYEHSALVNGFLEGYNTMDALAGLAFGVTVVTAVKSMGQRDAKSVSKVVAKSGVLAVAAIAVIYLLLILMGAMSLGKFKVSDNGGVAFNQIVSVYGGAFGQALLAFLITVTCLTTAVGLVAAFAQDFHEHFPRVSYHAWLALSCLASFFTANFGLDAIIAWSTPMLMFLYPLAMVLIMLSVCSPLFKRDGVVYFFVIVFTVVPALGDMFVAFPSVVSRSGFGLWVAGLRAHLPLASMGLSWLVPALIGLACGLLVHYLRSRKAAPVLEEE